MIKAYAFALGKARGRQAALNTDFDPSVDRSLAAAAFESEENSRQYDDFVRIADEIDMDDDADELWETYDSGVAAGIKAGVKERTGKDVEVW